MVRRLYTLIRTTLTERAAVRAAAKNSVWLLLDKMARLVGGLFVGIWVARYMAPDNFGLFNSIVAISGLALTFSGLGIEAIMVRYIVKYPRHDSLILGTAVGLRIISGAIIGIGLCGIPLFIHYQTISPWIWVLIATTMITSSVSIIRQWFEARVASKFVVISELGAFLISTILKIIGVVCHFPLNWFVTIVIAESVFAIVGYGGIYLRQKSAAPWRFSGRIARVLFRQSWPMLLSSLALILYTKIDQVMILSLAGSNAAGTYAAAARLLELTYFLPSIIFLSIFPAMTRLRKADFKGYLEKLQLLLSMITLTAYLVAGTITMLAPWLILSLYGSKYADASLILSVNIWALPWVCLSCMGHIFILNEKLTRFAVVKDCIAAALNIGLNWILIPRYGALGSVFATLIAFSFTTFWGNALFPPLRPLFKMQLSGLRLAGLATKIREINRSI